MKTCHYLARHNWIGEMLKEHKFAPTLILWYVAELSLEMDKWLIFRDNFAK